jgi:hypothetical protein
MLLRNPAYDVRPLLDGTGPLLSALAGRMARDAGHLLHCHQPASVALADQATVSTALAEAVRVCEKSNHGVLAHDGT